MAGSFGFSERTSWEMGENPLSKALADLRTTGAEVIDLTESNPTRCGFSYSEESFLLPLSDSKSLLYAPHPKGMLCARQAISSYYAGRNIVVDPERLVLTSSTSEAYTFLFRLLFEPGDRVLVPAPSYPLFSYLAGINDVEVDYYRLVFKKGEWRIELSSVESSVTTVTKAIILVSPNNPTGSCVKMDELVQLNDICLRHGMSLLCDEVFGDYIFDYYRPQYFSLAENSVAPTFVLGGVSKALALPQMKLSWIAVNGPAPVVEGSLSRLEVIADTYLSVNTPVQNAVSAWLPQAEIIQQQVMERVTGNYSVLREEFAKSGRGTILPVEGGWYAVIALPQLKDGEAFALKLLEQEHVFLHPGYFFDFEDEGFLVVSLLPNPEAFRAGVQGIVKNLAAG